MKLVPREISDNEPCVRCIVHPFMYSIKKGKLRREALMPAPDSTDVSLLRLAYTTKEFCIEHGKSMKFSGSTFYALASIERADVKEINSLADDNENDFGKIRSDIIYGPIHKGEYILNKDVYVEDPDVELPMHADLRYNMTNAGEVRTKLRKYASALVNKMKMISI